MGKAHKMVVEIIYINYKGVTSTRTILPKRLVFETNRWHLKEQWLLEAFDFDKKDIRYFSMKDILSWKEK